MKILPIILIAVGVVVFIAGIAGIIFFIDIVCDSPEDIGTMSQEGETRKVYGTIFIAPEDYDFNGWPDPIYGSRYKRYNYTFVEGNGDYYFYSENKLDVEAGSSYVIEIEYKNARTGQDQPEGPALKDESTDSISGVFTYRLPGIAIGIVGLGVVGVGVFLITIEVKKKIKKTKEGSRKKEAVNKQMELLEREIQMAIGAGSPRPDIHYQAPPGQQQVPPQAQRQMQPGQQMPPTGQMPPRGPPGPPFQQ